MKETKMDDMMNQEILEKIKTFAAKMVWYCLQNDPEQTKRWGERMKCGKWCAEQRGIGGDEIGKYELAGAEMAIEEAAKGDSTEWMEVLK